MWGTCARRLGRYSRLMSLTLATATVFACVASARSQDQEDCRCDTGWTFSQPECSSRQWENPTPCGAINTQCQLPASTECIVIGTERRLGSLCQISWPEGYDGQVPYVRYFTVDVQLVSIPPCTELYVYFKLCGSVCVVNALCDGQPRFSRTLEVYNRVCDRRFDPRPLPPPACCPSGVRPSPGKPKAVSIVELIIDVLDFIP